MCELFGFSAEKPVSVDFSFHEFVQHGGHTAANADGWGAIFFEDGAVRQLREPQPASGSPWVRLLEKSNIPTGLMMSHIRRATKGNVALKNTHPFTRQMGRRNHAFAHNGGLENLTESGELSLTGSRFLPVGDTDSEMAYCALLHRMAGLWRDEEVPAPEARFEAFREFSSHAKKHGIANFLYCDGEILFAHADKRHDNDGNLGPGLWSYRRTVRQSDMAVHGGMSLSAARDELIVSVVASVPLPRPGEQWTALEEGHTYAFRDGERIASAPPPAH